MGYQEDISNFRKNMSLVDIYRKAGGYFYVGVSSIVLPSKQDVFSTSSKVENESRKMEATRSSSDANASGYAGVDSLAKDMIRLCLKAEKEMAWNSDYKFLFDMLLVSVSLLLNGTSDLSVLRIIRRQLLKVEKLKNLHKITDFVDGKYEVQHGLRYGDYIRYKMCIGVLFAKIKSDSLFEIVSSFYINFPLTQLNKDAFRFTDIC